MRMNISMTGSLRSTQTRFLTSLVAICFPVLPAHAQPDDTSTNEILIIRPADPIWLLEQPYADNPMLTARTYGNSAYGNYQVNANLQILCYPQSRAAGLALQITPSPLGFDSAPFEGPDATANGPLHITMGTGPAVDHRVSGIWTVGGFFQLGSIFAFNTSLSRDELVHWASDASRGQSLNLSLAPAKSGGVPLTATFSLPKNNAGLKKVIESCLK
jgi:hypothetical protein